MPQIKILGLCGSLRAQSTNRSLLEAAELLAPPEMHVVQIVDGSIVPHFNPDLEGTASEPHEATQWRNLVAQVDGIILSSPEYAAGVPGALKNALDWLVGDPRFYLKPIAIFAASERSLGASQALRLILSTMSADVVESSSIKLPLLGKSASAQQICLEAAHRDVIASALRSFAEHIAAQKAAS
jgi:NAD(P)H-dependent FMN reductase